MTVSNSVKIDVSEIPDSVTSQYMADLMSPQPVPFTPEAPIEREASYVFRTKARTTDNPVIRVPGITNKQEVDEKLAEKWRKVYARKHGDKADVYEALLDAVGSRFIRFNRLGPAKGAVYQTDSPIVADFLRGVIAKGGVPGLYEDFAKSAPLRSRFTEQTFPNTEDGREALAMYDMAFEKAQANRAEKESAAKSATKGSK